MKLLIALQFWSGDRSHAWALSEYLADLEEKHSDIADVLLVNRFDCPYLPERALKKLSRKFNVFQYKTRSRLTGWPSGCNGLWLSTMEWVRSMSYGGKAPHYKCVFTCEADGAPIHRNWIERLHVAWDRSNSLQPVIVAGPMVGSNEPDSPVAKHINGNLLHSGRREDLDWTLKVVPSIHPMVGWDYGMRWEFEKKGWADTPEIKSYYNSKTFSPEEYQKMLDDNLAWVHGDKSGILISYGRQRYCV